MPIKLSVLIFLFCFISPGGYAQDILYKSNGERVNAKVFLKTRYELTYRMTGNKDSVLYHISTSTLDSALYGDGTKDIFVFKRTGDLQKKTGDPVYGPHLVGFDAGAFVFYQQSLSVSYEYLLLKRHLGMKAQFGTDIKETMYYDFDLQASATRKGHFSRFGLNWYIFPPGSFRFSAGLHFIASKYNIQGEKWITDENPPYESRLEYVQADKKYRFMVMNISAFYQIFKNLAVNAGIDFPARGPDDPGAIFRSEILINF